MLTLAWQRPISQVCIAGGEKRLDDFQSFHHQNILRKHIFLNANIIRNNLQFNSLIWWLQAVIIHGDK